MSPIVMFDYHRLNQCCHIGVKTVEKKNLKLNKKLNTD
jgi:hypothetical protein